MNDMLWNLVNDHIVDITILSDWYLSCAYLAHGLWSNYVIRKAKPHTPWYEYPWDIDRSYLISHEMFGHAYDINQVRSYGIYRYEDETYHVQQYISWDIKQLAEYCEEDIIQVATKLAKLHSIDHVDSTSWLLYRRSLREVVVNHETILSLYEQSHWANVQLSTIVHNSFETYMSMSYLPVTRRCVMLHGDFWHNNIIFNTWVPYFIDFSRIPYGEAGIDVGHFLANLEIEYVLTGDEKYQQYYSLFLQHYISITEDVDIEKYCVLSKHFVIWVCISDKIQHFLQREQDTIDKVIALL